MNSAFFCRASRPAAWNVQRSLLSLGCAASGLALAFKSAQADAFETPSATRKDPSTSVELPTRLNPINAEQSLSLVGLGLRTVSLFSIRVYVAGFYISDDAQSYIKRTWRNYSKATLLDSESKVASEPKGEELMNDLLSQPYEFAISIYPYRKTDLGHFRDSFLRHISNRMKDALASQTLSEADAEGVSASLDDLRVCFPKASAPIGEPLVLLRRADGSLAFEWKGATLGIIKNRWTAKHLLLAYFSRKNVISQKLQESVAEGFEELLGVPSS